MILAVGCRFSHRSTKGLLLNLELRPDQALIQIDLDPRTIGRMHAPALGHRRRRAGRPRGHPRGPAARRRRRTRVGLGGAPAGAGRAEPPLHADGGRPPPGAPRGAAGGRRSSSATRPASTTGWSGTCPIWAPRTFLYPDRLGDARLRGAGGDRRQGRVARTARSSPSSATAGSSSRAPELATAAKYRLPIVFVVMNDQDYGAIRYLQSRLYGRTGEHALAGPDVLALARAFGVEAYRAGDPETLPLRPRQGARAPGARARRGAARRRAAVGALGRPDFTPL